jgi:hypothetical protein
MRTRVQASEVASQSTWLELLHSPAAWLAGVSLFFRLVLWPAIRTLLRQDLKPELEQVSKIPVLEERVGRVEEAIASVPKQLARIEALLEDRR